MSEVDLNSIQLLFKKAHIQALSDNLKAYDRWRNFKADSEGLQERLNTFLKSMNVPVMIPIGNKAMFKGKMVHTNEIYISLGEGYFIKGSVEQALEVNKRRIEKCDEMLQSLDKEKQLLESRVNVTNNLDAFPYQGTSEIIENYDPEEETKWKEEHSKKVKEYKKKLAQLKENEPKLDNVDDLFKRLDLLEMQEELEDELDRLVDEEYDSSSEESSSENESIERDDRNNLSSNDLNDSLVSKSNSEINPILKNVSTLSNDISADDCIRIYFKHSSRNPHLPPHDNVINSPADIYSRHCLSMKEVRKPFKKVTFLESTITKPPEENTTDESPQVEAFGDIVERTTPSSAIVTSSRPISKFKSSRKL